MSDDDSDEDKVGPGNPPKRHQWKPGQSGNPKGRPPKKETTKAEDLIDLLDAPVTVKRKGRETKMSGFEASVRQLAAKAIRDRNMSAAREFLKLCVEHNIIERPVRQTYGGVLWIPWYMSREEFDRRLAEDGPPPWDDE